MSTSAPASAHAPRPHDGLAHDDAPRPRRSSAGSSLAKVAVMAALMAVLGMAPKLVVAGVPAPIVLQNIAVMLAGVVLGPWRGAAAMLLFDALVALGLPLLTGGNGGLGVFAGPTAGFILGWIPAALITGLVFRALSGRAHGARAGAGRTGAGRVGVAAFVASVVGGVLALYACGVVGFMLIAHMALPAAVTSMLVFVPGDLLKAVVVALLAAGLWKAYPRAFA